MISIFFRFSSCWMLTFVLPVVLVAGCSRQGNGGQEKVTTPSVASQSLSVVRREKSIEFPQTPLMQAAPKAVFVHNMVSFRTPAISGVWDGWKREISGKASHDPSRLLRDGRRDIGAVDYPAIGTYDMNDPDAVEYQCQLLKMAGIDGIVFDLMGYQRDPWRLRSMKLYIQTMQRYGLQGIVCFENKFYEQDYAEPEEQLQAACEDMDLWLKLFDPVAYKVSGRPVLMVFEFRFTIRQLEGWLQKHPEPGRPILGHLSWRGPEWKSVFECRFGWTDNEPNFRADVAPYIRYLSSANALENQVCEWKRAQELFAQDAIQLYLGGVSPGFDDRGCWGWGKGPTKVEREAGQTYREKWEHLLGTNLNFVQIATWNDWMEGTTIEPSLEYGTQYLELTREYGAHFKGTRATSGNLSVPIWIYKVRKSSQEPAALKAATEASAAVVRGDFAGAEKTIRPWAEKLQVVELTLWDKGEK
jgi:glycoprotein endo-alpha-1,2-mannosidase